MVAGYLRVGNAHRLSGSAEELREDLDGQFDWQLANAVDQSKHFGLLLIPNNA